MSNVNRKRKRDSSFKLITCDERPFKKMKLTKSNKLKCSITLKLDTKNMYVIGKLNEKQHMIEQKQYQKSLKVKRNKPQGTSTQISLMY